MPAMLRLSFDEESLDARLGLTEFFRLVRDMEYVLHALLNPAHWCAPWCGYGRASIELKPFTG